MSRYDFNMNAYENSQEDLERMMEVLTESFTHVRSLLHNATGEQARNYARRIEQANMEFTRLRANSMRASMERNLARARMERRNRPRTEDSYSSTDSDSSDIDLDFYFPPDLTKFSSTSKTPSTSNQQSTSATATDSTLPVTEMMPEPMITDPPPAEKRKAAGELEGEPPAKRALATDSEHKTGNF